MKNKKHIPYPHSNKDKNSHANEAAVNGLYSDTNKTVEENVNMPRGAESDYKEELRREKTNQHSLSKTPKQ